MELSIFLPLFLLTFHQTKCKELVDASHGCEEKIPKLQVLPGLGWDSLKSEDLARVMQITYTQCKTTDDGRYLIPDDTTAITVKTTDLQTNVELIDHWLNYTSITARSFKVATGGAWNLYYFYLDGAFSSDYQVAKSRQVRERAAASRVYVKNSMYRLQMEPNSKLTPSLKTQFIQVMKCISRNETAKAEYLVDLIVRDYGTHFVRNVEAGAIFLKEDFVSTAFVQANEGHRSKIAAAAEISFLQYYKLSGKYDSGLDDSLLKQYTSNKISQRVRSIGGPVWRSGMEISEWHEKTLENLVAIDRSGDFLHHLITPTRFPRVQSAILKKLYDMLSEGIIEYYKYNAHEGCTKLESPNFDYSANVDDGSCTGVSHNYFFGGIYTTCYQSSNREVENMCQRYGAQEVNALTGKYNCPSGYTANKLYIYQRSDTNRQYKTYEKCKGWWIFKKCWTEGNFNNVNLESQSTTYWCSAEANPDLKDNYLFGGLYSPETTNIITKTASCPPNFFAKKVLEGSPLTICISNDVPAARRLAIPFAGLRSCISGLRCPDGYTGHLATTIHGCQINYCIRGSTVDKFVTMSLLRPPYRDHNASIIFDYEDEGNDVDFNDYGMIQKFQDQSDEKENSAYIGIIISLTLFLVVVILAFVYWQKNCIIFHLQQILHQFPQSDSKAPKSISEDTGPRTICIANTKKNGPLLTTKSQTLNRAWAPVTQELKINVLKKNHSRVNV